MSCHVMVSWRVSLLMRFWSLPQPNTLIKAKPSQGRAAGAGKMRSRCLTTRVMSTHQSQARAGQVPVRSGAAARCVVGWCVVSHSSSSSSSCFFILLFCSANCSAERIASAARSSFTFRRSASRCSHSQHTGAHVRDPRAGAAGGGKRFRRVGRTDSQAVGGCADLLRVLVLALDRLAELLPRHLQLLVPCPMLRLRLAESLLLLQLA